MYPVFVRDGKPFNPLNEPPVLDVEIPRLEKMPGERKVRRGFFLPDANLLMVVTDSTGAFDQQHFTEDGLKAHYTGKGIIATSFELMGRQMASLLMATDHVPLKPYLGLIPKEYHGRCSVKLPAKNIFPIEFVVRTGGEGSVVDKSQKGVMVCGQELPPNLKLGDALPRPYFTPTTKAPPGQKDRPITLEEYFRIIGNEDIANYLYGMAVLLHLLNRKVALKCGLDRPDQKEEFGLFEAGLPVYHDQPESKNWSTENTILRFSDLCLTCGLPIDSWRKMPLFDIARFCQFAEENAQTGIIRLADEYGGTEDGRYRPWSDTLRGRELVAAGARELGQIFLENYLCKEYFRLASKRTGKGGYQMSADQRVTIPDAVLRETGRRNLMARLMLSA